MNKTLRTWVAGGVVAASGLLWSHTASAQAPADQPPVVDPGYAPAVRYPDSGFSFLHHSSTVAEGAYRGAAAYVRALGAANLDNSLAAMNYQEAYRRSLENTLKYAETYYARRDLWFDYQETHRRKPLTMEGYRRLAEAAGADRLTANEYDMEKGQIRWPELLKADVLSPYRTEIDKAIATRSGEPAGLGSRTYEIVRQMTEEMQTVLDRNRENVPAHLYVHATKFLENVRFESRFNAFESSTADNENAAANNVVPVSGQPADAPVVDNN